MYDPENHFLHQLGMVDVEPPPGADLAMALPIDGRMTNPRGGLQGGILATLVDVTAGRAALRLAGEGHGVPTSDLHIRFLSPITVGPAVAAATVIRHGRNQIVLQVDVRDEGRVRDEQSVLAATCTLMFTIVASRPGQNEGSRVFERAE